MREEGGTTEEWTAGNLRFGTSSSLSGKVANRTATGSRRVGCRCTQRPSEREAACIGSFLAIGRNTSELLTDNWHCRLL